MNAVYSQDYVFSEYYVKVCTVTDIFSEVKYFYVISELRIEFKEMGPEDS